jgi:hypothetical protein
MHRNSSFVESNIKIINKSLYDKYKNSDEVIHENDIDSNINRYKNNNKTFEGSVKSLDYSYNLNRYGRKSMTKNGSLININSLNQTHTDIVNNG